MPTAFCVPGAGASLLAREIETLWLTTGDRPRVRAVMVDAVGLAAALGLHAPAAVLVEDTATGFGGESVAAMLAELSVPVACGMLVTGYGGGHRAHGRYAGLDRVDPADGDTVVARWLDNAVATRRADSPKLEDLAAHRWPARVTVPLDVEEAVIVELAGRGLSDRAIAHRLGCPARQVSATAHRLTMLAGAPNRLALPMTVRGL
ncbi:hypothetical protein ACFSSC_09475 [Corynebacterium mendelii]|uniref:Uncharacterized protein n=1 Tax=Corynebacterium mendelii TaxID=2765362 RepID=A0A939E1X2_9CORY|nr:hypothetical protein [Corynebacterium mendelii]MBN9645208.1 hypothetical protein [Corynebacterium mendelii]